MDQNATYDSNRKRLGFEQAVTEHIAPILAAHGFTRVESSPYSVVFRSKAVSVEVVHECYPHQINVIFQRNALLSEHFYMGDVLEVTHGRGYGERFFLQSSDKDGVALNVRVIADLLRDYCGAVLAGDTGTYRRIKKISEERAEAYTKEVVQAPVRRLAEQAWRERDYAGVRKQYEKIEADLTPLEKRRLEYAKSRQK